MKAASPSADIASFFRKEDFLGKPISGWYWTDDYCDEPMGPFDTLEEAEADRSTMRVEHDRRREARARLPGVSVELDDFPGRLAVAINEAITSAEQNRDEGFMPYAYIVGHLIGHCTEDDISAIESRLERLSSSDTGAKS